MYLLPRRGKEGRIATGADAHAIAGLDRHTRHGIHTSGTAMLAGNDARRTIHPQDGRRLRLEHSRICQCLLQPLARLPVRSQGETCCVADKSVELRQIGHGWDKCTRIWRLRDKGTLSSTC